TRFSRDWSSDVCSSDLLFVLARGEIDFLPQVLLRRLDQDAILVAAVVLRLYALLLLHAREVVVEVLLGALHVFQAAAGARRAGEIGRASCRVSGVVRAD